MADQEQARKMKRPHCGWIRTVPASVVEEEGPFLGGAESEREE